MKTIGIVFVVALIGGVLSNQPPMPGLEEICAASREPFKNFVDCLGENLPETYKAAASAFLECLGQTSFVGLLDTACEKVAAGEDENKMLMELSRCNPGALGIPEPPVGDQRQAGKAFDTCFPLLLEYVMLLSE